MNVTNHNATKGLTIAGGTYPNDAARSFGVMTTGDISNSVAPSLMMVSGNSSIVNRSTLGVNTFSPVTENYVLDVNGPIYLHHNEVSLVNTTSHSVLGFSLSNDGTRMAGIGSFITFYNGNAIAGYLHPVSFSVDGGVSWDVSYCDASIFGSTFYNYNYTAIHVLSGTPFFFAGGYGGALFYSNDNGHFWQEIVVLNLQSFFASLYSVVLNANTIRIFASFQDTSYLYLDVSRNDLVNGSVVRTSYTKIVTDISFSSVASITGDQYNHVYVLGLSNYGSKNTSFLKQLDLNLNLLSYAEFNITQSNVSIHNSFLSVYGNNKLFWSPVPTGILNAFTSYTFNTNFFVRDVFFYDASRCVVVGSVSNTTGAVYSSSDGLSSFTPISDSILNSQGYETSLLSFPFVRVFMKDLHSFGFISQFENNTNRIFYCYLPDVFDSTENNVLDVRGRVNITGNLVATNTMSSYSYANEISANNVHFNNCYIANNLVAGAISIQNVDISGNLTVSNTLTTTSFFKTYGGAAFNGAASFGNDLTVTGNAMFGNGGVLSNFGTWQQIGSAYLSDTVTMNGAVTLNGTTTYHGNVVSDGTGSIHLSQPIFVDTFVSSSNPSHIGCVLTYNYNNIPPPSSYNSNSFSIQDVIHVANIGSFSIPSAGVWNICYNIKFVFTANNVHIDSYASALSSSSGFDLSSNLLAPLSATLSNGYVSSTSDIFTNNISCHVVASSSITAYLNVAFYRSGGSSSIPVDTFTCNSQVMLTRIA